MKSIDTLIEDIHNVFQLPHEFSEERLEKFGKFLAKTVSYKINQEAGSGDPLRMSNIGTKCNRKLWYKAHSTTGEKLPVETRVKFLYGDILEALLLFLAEEAGHEVTGAQDEVEVNGVKGHRDSIIDGVLVDVKSASSYSFKDFKEHLTRDKDKFGYIDQLQLYLHASQNDPLLKVKDKAAFLVIDKTLGHICLDFHNKIDLDYDMFVEYKKEKALGDVVPQRGYESVDQFYKNSKGVEVYNGNKTLCTECSYCEFKKGCWPSLRTFIYSSGPKFFTKVVKEPNVPEGL